MRKCLICDRETTPRILKYGGTQESDICNICSRKRITNAYDYVADKKETEIIKQLVKIENLLL